MTKTSKSSPPKRPQATARMITTTEALSSALLNTNNNLDRPCCSSIQEAEAVADAILEDLSECPMAVVDERTDETLSLLQQERLVELIQEYCSQATAEDAQRILQEAVVMTHDESSSSEREEHECKEDTDDEFDKNEKAAYVDDVNVGGEFIGEGECELCERSSVQLTIHHLIPKSTHGRLETKLLHAANAVQKGDADRAHVLLKSAGLEHAMNSIAAFSDSSSSSRARVVRRWLLHQTCNICRPCHSAIHRTHDNMTLALNYNTIEKLLEDDEIHNFCHWASKQKPGKYARTTRQR